MCEVHFHKPYDGTAIPAWYQELQRIPTSVHYPNVADPYLPAQRVFDELMKKSKPRIRVKAKGVRYD